jgi:hypothetical protein
LIQVNCQPWKIGWQVIVHLACESVDCVSPHELVMLRATTGATASEILLKHGHGRSWTELTLYVPTEAQALKAEEGIRAYFPPIREEHASA